MFSFFLLLLHLVGEKSFTLDEDAKVKKKGLLAEMETFCAAAAAACVFFRAKSQRDLLSQTVTALNAS